MQIHLSLVVVLAVILLWEYQVARVKYHHHWCGIRLLHAIAIESAFPMLLVLLIYIEIFHTGETAINRRYWYLLSALGALVGHVTVHRFLPGVPKLDPDATVQPPKGFPIVIANRITQKKLIIADQLRGNPNCKDLLLRGIDASPEIASNTRSRLKRLVKHQQTDREIFSVIEEVGVAKMKLIVKGATNGEHAKASATQSNP